MMLRPEQPDQFPSSSSRNDGDRQTRLNLLLSYGGWREQSFADQLPRLLSPMGIRSIRVESGEEAEEVIRKYPVHIAVVDLTIPLRKLCEAAAPMPTSLTKGGARLLQLLRRLENQPPTVVIRPPEPSSRESAHSLVQSLREGAFTVLDRPVDLEHMLDVMRRILRRHYADLWPTSGRTEPDE
jgi:DNA-binding response OmpR family regulator